jgi:hypothetical protein
VKNPKLIILQGNSAVDIAMLILRRHIIISPCLYFTLYKPQGVRKCEGIINTGAKCNIFPEEVTKSLGYIIYKVKRFKILIAIRQKFGFIGIAQIKLKITDRIRYKNIFFLINKALKILLN